MASAESLESLESLEALLTAPGAPFAVVRDGSGRPSYAEGPRTLREFAETTWAFGDTPFLIADTGRLTYGEFFAAASALARRFLDTYGLRPGDRAVIAMRNHPEWQVAFWAAQLAGLVAVPLNAWWTADEVAYALDDCRPGVLVVDGERYERVAPWLDATGDDPRPWTLVCHEEGRAVGGPRVERYAELPAADPLLGPPDVDVTPESDATILYTSGTTGRPKGAVATHHAHMAAITNPRYFAALSSLGRGIVPGQGPILPGLLTFPFFHVAAFTGFYAAMAAGGTLVLMRKWDPDAALALIHEHGIGSFGGVPATALQLLARADEVDDDLPTLTMFNTGGAAAPPELVARLTARYGERIEPRNGYGLTETLGGISANFGAQYRRWPASVGRPAPAVEARVADPVAGVGELLLRGQALIRGYWEDPEATAAAFTDDGWFRTGDLAEITDGRISVVDRIKDMVIRGGENVYCVEVEACLHDHPDVLEAAVVGVPHPVLGEEVAAVVRIRPGSGLDAAALRAFAAKTLAAFKVPERVVLQESELPRNATGKVLKREVRRGLASAG
ncbi:class I adenylate-forming enzyme family protein [Streptomyces sp. VRA16 Mangrove soil]|uniref:class I adenylate-forming enzyme family protein n=1 Tax=Streptomyces sp. VRA16 Mangrove soil TaxID=2817434 RepID=UPI001A9CF4F8|nr:class I adenylate-forming enzyme family protein [Streptomyces sp. VRA16 Mangrove soil]MBO1337185.1 acyl--CoA ligase [Streptomyces sp. VRA16 Mangrove soil]